MNVVQLELAKPGAFKVGDVSVANEMTRLSGQAINQSFQIIPESAVVRVADGNFEQD